MVKKIFVNGAAGRIGRAVTFEISESKNPNLELAALNDLVGIDALVRNYTRRDSTHGLLPWTIKKIDDSTITINDRKVKVYAEKDPGKMELKENGINIVEECAGVYGDPKTAGKISPAEASSRVFLNYGVERVIMSYPATCDATLIAGANHQDFLNTKHKCISNGSCTTKALVAPLTALLNNGIGVDALLMDTVHAATNSGRILDFGDEYAVLDQIITAKTGAAKATAEVIPALKGKMDGLAFRVPTTDGSFANLYFVANHAGELSAELVNKILERSVNEPIYMGRLGGYYGKEAASTDIIGRKENGIVIFSKTKVIPLPYSIGCNNRNTSLVSIVSGYDNELGPPKDQVIITEYIADNS